MIFAPLTATSAASSLKEKLAVVEILGEEARIFWKLLLSFMHLLHEIGSDMRVGKKRKAPHEQNIDLCGGYL